MAERYPAYDVMAKRGTLSWNAPTRAAVDRRLATPRAARFLDPAAFRCLEACCARIAPGPAGQPPLPLAGLVDGKLLADRRDGYRDHRLPPLREAWRRGLAALDDEARAGLGQDFAALATGEQDGLLGRMQRGELCRPAWKGMPPGLFFSARLAHDILAACYALPAMWSRIGFGGPAGPRGYVRLQADRRDPWEAERPHG